jgi:hypothetical protein
MADNFDKSLESIKQLSPHLATSRQYIKYHGPWYHNSSDRFPFQSGTYKFLSIAEEQRSIPYKHFEYHVNELGYRNTIPDEQCDTVGVFGCSFTFAEGVANEDAFYSLIEPHTSLPTLNLGMIGCTSQQIASVFMAAANIWKMKYAIITLPAPERFHYVTSENKHWPVYPKQDRHASEHENVRKSLYKNFSTEHFWHSTKDVVVSIAMAGKLHGIPIIWGSWNEFTKDIVSHTLNTDCLFFDYKNPDGSVLKGDWIGRDNMHPGIAQHKLYADKVLQQIERLHIK